MLSSEERNQLEEIKPGDEVALRRVVYGRWRWTVATINRLTPQHLVIGADLFSKRTGEIRGYFKTQRQIAPLNAQTRQRICNDAEQLREEQIREECITTLYEDLLRTLPTCLLQELAQQVQQYLESQGRRIPDTVEGWTALRGLRL